MELSNYELIRYPSGQLVITRVAMSASGVPLSGPRDVIGGHPQVGALDEDLRAAALRALELSRHACRAFALERSWEASAQQFIAHASRAAGYTLRPALRPLPAGAQAELAA